MTDKPWTYHEFHHSPRRKTYSVMEGIRPVAACSREKDARLIVSMKDTNAKLLEAVKELLADAEDSYHTERAGISSYDSDAYNEYHDLIHKAKELLK